MKESLLKKLLEMKQRHHEITQLLSQSEIVQDTDRFRELSKEYAQLAPKINRFLEYERILKSQEDAQALLNSEDAELRLMAKEEFDTAQQTIDRLEKELLFLLLPPDPDETKNVFLEIRAGTGGHEAAIFVGDLFRMYSRYAETHHWRVEIMNSTPGEYGGYKEMIARILGERVYGKLQFESGVHRVQRVPETEAQGRVHTSTVTVAVLPEVDEVDHIDVRPEDLRVDTFRSSGAGGQSVNKTESAIRITHLPTGIVVECQDERSQHQNRARALSVLKARLLAQEREQQRSERAETRKNLIGTGERSERIRTYNFPQNRLTDHRIGLTLYQLDSIIEGHLELVIEPLIEENKAKLLEALGTS